MDVFIISIVVKVSKVYTYVKTYQIVHFKYGSSLHVNYASIFNKNLACLHRRARTLAVTSGREAEGAGMRRIRPVYGGPTLNLM